MFCEKCGAKLPDTASFCNKCGNTLRKKVNTGQIPIAKPQKSVSSSNINVKKSPKEKSGNGFGRIVLALVVIAIIGIVAVVGVTSIKKKTSIYGTWTDANKTMTFTFDKSGNLRISGSNNILGADTFTFTEEDGMLRLQVQGLAGSSVAVEVKYKISDDNLTLTIKGQDINLYRVKDSDATGDFVEDFVEDALDTVQILSLYGTWSDSYGAVSFTFQKDGKIRISGLEDTLGVDVFTFTEVDDDTLQLKAESDNPILGAVGVNLDYEITGDTMTVSIAGKTFKLVKKD